MPTSRLTGRRVVLLLGVLLLAAGLVMRIVATPRTFGWFAYQPLPLGQAVPAPLFPGQLWGLATALLGALLLSGLLGHWIARRHITARAER